MVGRGGTRAPPHTLQPIHLRPRKRPGARATAAGSWLAAQPATCRSSHKMRFPTMGLAPISSCAKRARAHSAAPQHHMAPRNHVETDARTTSLPRDAPHQTKRPHLAPSLPPTALYNPLNKRSDTVPWRALTGEWHGGTLTYARQQQRQRSPARRGFVAAT